MVWNVCGSLPSFLEAKQFYRKSDSIVEMTREQPVRAEKGQHRTENEAAIFSIILKDSLHWEALNHQLQGQKCGSVLLQSGRVPIPEI